MTITLGRAQSGNVASATQDANFQVPQTVPAGTVATHAVNKAQLDAAAAALAAADAVEAGLRLAGDTGLDTRVLALEGKGSITAPVERQENTYTGGLTNGQRLLVGPAPTAVLSGFANQIATVTDFTIPTFTFAVPFSGAAIFVKGSTIAGPSGVELSFDGTGWSESQSSFVANLTTNDANSGLAASQGPAIVGMMDAPKWGAALVYAIGDRVTHLGLVYQASAVTVAGESPISTPAKWAAIDTAVTATLKADYDVTRPVLSATTLAQPAHVAGARYLLNGVATGADWAGHNFEIATSDGAAWTFAIAPMGARLFVVDGKHDVIRTPAGWERDGSTLDKSTLGGLATILPDSGAHFQPLYDAAGNPVGKAALLSITTGGSIPSAEYGETSLAASFIHPGPASTWVDTGLVVTIPSSGVWEIRGQLRGLFRPDTADVVYALFNDAVSATVPLAGSEVSPGYVTGTNNLTDQHQGTGPVLFRYTAAGATTLKLKSQVANYVVGSAGLLADANGRTRLAWEKISGFTPVQSAVVMETGEAVMATPSMALTSTVADVAGCATPVLGAGTWRIDAFATHEDADGNSNAMIQLADQAGTYVPNSLAQLPRSGVPSGHSSSAHASVDVVSDGSKSIKLRASGSSGSISHNQTVGAATSGTTKIRWTKIAGNVPVSNSSESVVALSDNGTGASQSTTSTAYVDIANATLTLPSAGEWEVTLSCYVAHSIAGNVSDVAITDMAGTVLYETSIPAVTASTTSSRIEVMLPSYVIGSASQIKGRFRTRTAGTATILNSTTAGSAGKPRFSARKVGGLASIPSTVAEVSGSVSLLSNQATAANTNIIDSGLSFIAPEAGTYEVSYEAVVSNAVATGSTRAVITDASDNEQSDSRRSFTSTAIGNLGALAGSCRMTLDTGDVAKLRFQSGGANISTMYGDGALNGRSVLKWRKVSGYVAGASVPNTFPSVGDITALGSTIVVGQINRVNTAAFSTAGGLIVSGPLTGADGDWFGVLDAGSTFDGLNKQCVIAFAAGQTFKGAAQNVTLANRDELAMFVRSGGTWRLKSKWAPRIPEIALANFAANGSIGSAAATVDIADGCVINQSTINIHLLTIPTPTDQTAGQRFSVRNSGTENVGVAFSQIAPNATEDFIWTGPGGRWRQVGSKRASVTFANGNLSSRSIICGGLEFQLNTNIYNTACYAIARIIDTVDLGSSFQTTTFVQRHPSGVPTVNQTGNPSMDTNYVALFVGSVAALDINYVHIKTTMSIRGVTGAARTWVVEYAADGSTGASLSVEYFGK